MENLSLTVVLVFAAMLAWFLAALAWSIGRNLSLGYALQRRLGERLAAVPLARVLERAGTDPIAYLHSRRVHAIETELRRCEGCQATGECSAALADGLSSEKFVFCPNYGALFRPEGVDRRTSR